MTQPDRAEQPGMSYFASRLALLLLCSLPAQLGNAGYVVLMGDGTPLFSLAYNFTDSPTDGPRMFFRNMLGSGDSVAVVHQERDSVADLVSIFFERIPNVASKRIRETVSDVSLAGVDFLVIANQKDDFVGSEVAAIRRAMGQGANLLVFNDPQSAGGDNARHAANRLLQDLGVDMRIDVTKYIYSHGTLTEGNIREHPLTFGVANFTYGSAVGVTGGTPLFISTEGISLVAAAFVPEPSAAPLLAIGLIVLAGRRRTHHLASD